MPSPPSEITPLIHNNDYVPASPEDAAINQKENPLPLDQMAVLCFARVVDPMIAFAIQPYIQQEIEHLGVAEADVGFYSGLIESLQFLVKVLFLIPWTSAADRFGRRPILIISLLGICIGTFGFGFSTTIWQLIFFRCFTGFFAGIEPSLRLMITENSDDTNRARAYSYFANTNNVGLLFGPIIGGALADPISQYPNVFGGSAFFEKYPYSLPMLILGTLAVIATITTFLYAKETAPALSKAYTRVSDDDSSSETIVPIATSSWSIILRKEVLIVIAVYVFTFAVAFGYTAVNPLFFFTSTNLGGFGFSTLQISVWMAVTGVSQTLWMFFPFPALQKRIGTAGILRLCAVITPIVYATGPIIQPLLRTNALAAHIAFYTILSFLQTAGMIVAMSYEAVSLAVNDVSPDSAALSKITSVAMTLCTSVQAVTPWASTSLYAVGVGHHILGGQLAWVVLVSLAVGVAGVVWIGLPRKIVHFK